MDEIQQMREELEREFSSGRQHPRMVLQNAIAAEDKEAAALVLEVGSPHLDGKEKVSVAALYNRHFPRDETAHKRQRDETRAESERAIGQNLQARVTERRERKLARPSSRSVGWNVPPRDDEGWRSA